MSVRGLILGLLTGLCVLVFGAGSAGAAAGYGDVCVLLGPPGLCTVGTFAFPAGVAVDNSAGSTKGDVYVVDLTKSRVLKFNAAGEPVSFEATGTPELDGGSTPKGSFSTPAYIAVGPNGDIYVVNLGEPVIDVFNAKGEYVPQAPGGFVAPSFEGGTYDPVGVGVDQENGDVYVSDRQDGGIVDVFEADGTFVRQFPTGAGGSDSVAVNSSGDVYVDNENASVTEFTATGAPLGTLDAVAPQAVAVDPANQSVFVGENGGSSSYQIAEYAAPAAPGEAPVVVFGNGTFASNGSYGIAVNGTTHQVYASNAAGEDGLIFEEGPTPEAPRTEAATEVTAASAELHGTLSPGGTKGELEYTFDYNSGLACAGAGSTPVPPGKITEASKEMVEAQATGLSPKTKYTFCLVATDPFGSVPGLEISFETLAAKPSIQSQSTPETTRMTATVSAVIDPEGADTTCKVQYGLTASYGSEAPCPTGLGEGTTGVPVSVKLTGLQPEEIYHYQFIATNTVGTSEGHETEDATFETEEAPEQPATGAATGVSPNTAVLNGKLNPGGLTGELTYYFEYNLGSSCSGGEATAQSTVAEAKDATVQTEVTGLTPATRYTFCLVATDKFGTVSGPAVSVSTHPSQPAIETESVVSVGSTEVTLSAQLNAKEMLTGYHVDYGTNTSYGSSTPEVSIGRPAEPIDVQVRLSDLQPGTLYHYHFIATNTYLGAEGTDATFTTAQALAAQQTTLPDNRAYELVSLPENSEVYYPDQGLASNANVSGVPGFRAAADGDAVAYAAGPPATGVGGGGLTGQEEGNEYLATRGPNGWEAQDIEPVTNVNKEGIVAWDVFSSDLSVEVFHTGYPVKAEPEPAAECAKQREEVIYSHTAGGYHAVPKMSGVCGGEAVGSSADGAHILYSSSHGGIYDAFDGDAYPVDVLPDGEPEPNPNSAFGGFLVNQVGGKWLSNIISSDASRVFWTSLKTEVTPEDPAGKTRLFVRENDTQPQSPIGVNGECTVSVDACTVQLDLAQKGATGSSGGGHYWTASGDGSKVFFTDCSRLTVDSTAVPGGGCEGSDLYEYDFNKPPGERLTDLTVDEHVSDHLGADVQGVIGASEDGSYVYFVASGALTAGANSEAKEPVAGEPNLYMRHGDKTTFIVTLAPEDDRFLGPKENEGYFHGIGDWRGDLGLSSAEVASEGREVGFMSRLSLTGYENGGLPEVFVYDADVGRISCASCNAGGVPPVAPAEFEEGGERGGFVTVSANDTFRTRWINAEGSEVFFDTDQPLVSQDTNGHQDVYEWERDGTGSCGQSAGCISLLSTGTVPSNAYFVDSSANGDDAFFTTRALLVPRARDEDAKLYDARVDGGFSETTLACTGTGCQGVPPAPPIFATPSSATFNGVGNFEPSSTPVVKPRSKAVKCKRGFVKKHGRCVSRKPKKSSKRSKKGRSK